MRADFAEDVFRPPRARATRLLEGIGKDDLHRLRRLGDFLRQRDLERDPRDAADVFRIDVFDPRLPCDVAEHKRQKIREHPEDDEERIRVDV